MSAPLKLLKHMAHLLVKPIECASKKRNIVQLLLAPPRAATASLQQRCACTPAPWQQPLAQAYSPRHALFLSKRHCARRPAHELAALQPSRRIQARNRARALLHGVASSCSCCNQLLPQGCDLCTARARRHVKSQASTGPSRVLQSNRLRSACRHRSACAAAAR